MEVVFYDFKSCRKILKSLEDKMICVSLDGSDDSKEADVKIANAIINAAAEHFGLETIEELKLV